jgi:leucyl aminopeptidase
MINIKIETRPPKKTDNLVLFSRNNFSLLPFDKSELNIDNDTIEKFIVNNHSDDKEIIYFNSFTFKRVFIVDVSNVNSFFDIEKLGGKFFGILKKGKYKDVSFSEQNIIKIFKNDYSYFEHFVYGVKLKSYTFKKYKTNFKNQEIDFSLFANKKINLKTSKKLNALLQGVKFTKDLVSEPGNILHPDEYVNRIRKLKSFGLKISILDNNKLKKLGMNALLGVGQGSARGSYLAIIEWLGASDKKKQPIAFVGKGVCFDTGGISLKPAKFMEDMTYDMAGSAVVVGLMKTLALRKAAVNAVGVVGLVENMPDGNAQRPGDIVKSYSGKTIEILNTDAEGRLVLADALTYTEKKFKPKFIIDLATLTGAIIVSLGSEYAGLFSNDDKISKQLSIAGEKVGEKVWRMPLNENYDKLINSKKADMQNINYVGGAGSTTAAQFLQRFILNKTPWAHLDIAGMAFSKYGGALNSEGATGYGVRLLNQLIEDNYE